MSDTTASAALPGSPSHLGFLSILNDAGGILGGYLVTNTWGRPVEFRLTSAVQPTRAQQILYGPTLGEYLHADLIGKTLVEKTGTLPGLIVVDAIPALALRSRIEVPVIAVAPKGEVLPLDAIPFSHPRCTAGLLLPAAYESDRATILARLEKVDPAVDLAEPFARVREAVAESRKMGVSRAA